jgi:hypothetical protein
MSLPEIVSREEWLVARKELLAAEKEQTRARDALNARRRMLPMVAIEKDYLFEGPDGTVSLLDLFEGRRQLIVDHFMFDPEWDEGCSSCSGRVDQYGNLAHTTTATPRSGRRRGSRSCPASCTARASSCATATVSSTPTRRTDAGPSRWAGPTTTSI